MGVSTSDNGWSEDADLRHRRAMIHAVLRGVVHDLNNPLATVAMAAAALRVADDAEQRDELLDIVEREVMRAGRLAADASARFALTEESGRPTELGRVLEQLRGWCRERRLEVELHAGATTDGVSVHADQALLPRALQALVEDAHANAGRRRPVGVEASRHEDEVIVTIADDGAPIPDRVSQRPFAPYVAELPAGRGIGLDVATARVVLSAHGAALTLNSDARSGNVVTVRLPVADDVSTDGDTRTTRRPDRR